MASGPITLWQIDGKKMETVRYFIFWVIAVMKLKDACSSEEKLWPTQHIKKQSHYFATKGLVKAIVFPVVKYGWESWTIKKTKHRRIDAFELWCWRRVLRVPWTARRSNQSTVKEISLEQSLEVLMLKVKLQYFGHLMRGQMTHWKRTMLLEKIEGRRRKGWQRTDEMAGWHHRLVTWVWARSGICWRIGKPGMLQSMGLQRVRHNWVTKLNQTLLIFYDIYNYQSIRHFYVHFYLFNVSAIIETPEH